MLKILQYCMSLCLGSGILEYVGGLKFSRSSPSISRALQRCKGHSHGWSGSRNFFSMYSHNSDPVSSSKDPKMRPDSWHFMCLQTYPPRYPPVKTAGVAGAEDRQLGNDSTKPDASSWTLRLGLIFQVHTCIIYWHAIHNRPLYVYDEGSEGVNIGTRTWKRSVGVALSERSRQLHPETRSLESGLYPV